MNLGRKVAVYLRRMKPHLPVLLCASVLLLNACGGGKGEAAQQGTATRDSVPATTPVDLSAQQLPLMLQLPAGLPEPSILWKDQIGKLEVRAGDHFSLQLYEAPPSLDRLKADLDRDLLRKNTVVEETPGLLIYRSQFPDDSTLVFHHFSRTITVGDRSFQVEDLDADAPYSLEEIRRMAAAVQAKQAL